MYKQIPQFDVAQLITALKDIMMTAFFALSLTAVTCGFLWVAMIDVWNPATWQPVIQ